MKISVNCKLDNQGVYDFLRPLSDLDRISHLNIFRDFHGYKYDKLYYHCPQYNTHKIITQLSKVILMVRHIPKDTKICIGIYELPHGLIAYLIGKFWRIPVVISIISNPGYTVIRKGLRKKISNFMYKRCSAITVTGTKSKNYLIQNGINRKKIFIIVCPIDIEYFKVIPSVKKKYDIISIGRLSPEKELFNLLKIVSILKNSMPNIKVGIAGNGPERKKIEMEISRLHLESNVDMLGYINDTADCFNSGRIFVLTSSSEGLPRTILQAMACGLPCVSSDVGDISDIITNGINGYLIEDYKDIENYVKVIHELLFSPNNTKLGRRARESIEKYHSYESTSLLWDNILRHIDNYEYTN